MSLRGFRTYVFLMLLLLAMPTLASAHANLERSSPLQNEELKESPSEIRIKFTEEIDPKLSQITLEDENGKSIEGRLSAEEKFWLIFKVPKLVTGVYKVKWQVLSVDTHVTEGSFRFSVAVPLEEEKPDETISLDEEEAPTPQGSTNPAPATKPGTNQQSSPVTKPAEEKPAATPVNPHTEIKLDEAIPSGKSDDQQAGMGAPPEPSKLIPEAPDQDIRPSSTPDSKKSVKSGENTDQPENRPTGHEQHSTLTVEETHNRHHDDSGHSGGWGTFVYQFLRIVEVLFTVCIAGFFFFRYTLWGVNKPDVPALFSKRNERLLLGIALIGFCAAGILHVWMLADQLSGIGTRSPGGLSLTILGTTMIGTASWMKPALTVLLLTLSFAPIRDERWATVLKAAAVCALVLLFPLTGHAYGSSSVVSLAVLSHTLHIMAAAVWFGGLTGILAATFKTQPFESDWKEMDSLVRRFSRIALPSMIVVALSGIALSLLRLKSWGVLFQSEYGQLVLAKNAILLFVVVIGAFHRLVIIPRMEDEATSKSKTDALQRFIVIVRLEVFLAIAAFVLAGMLSTTSPPEIRVTTEPVYWHVMGDKAHMSFSMYQTESKGQTFRLDVWLLTGMGPPNKVYVQAGRENGEGKGIIIPFEYKKGGPDPYGYEGFDKYTYETEGDYLNETGSWKITIDITDSKNQVHHYEKVKTIP
ncbi:CopD family protein [Paenibacillus sp. Soil522]|uniref:CopD family protein n=1 Tax=Paenibacillus sp. Soil522 TaxID=1736388 RepID=UPI0012DE9756|nr:CopD family protein [Paenibacillus sp. Soil522]